MTEPSLTIPAESDLSFALPKGARIVACGFLILTAWFSLATFAFMHFARNPDASTLIFFARPAYFLASDSSVSLLRDVTTAIATATTNCAYFILLLRIQRWRRLRVWQSVGWALAGVGSALFWTYVAVLQSLDFDDFLMHRYAGEEPALSGAEKLGLVSAPLLGTLALEVTVLSVYLHRRARGSVRQLAKKNS